jgi:hypothetical protein
MVWSKTPDGRTWFATTAEGYGCDLFWPCLDFPSGEPAHVARYAFQLAQSFSNFYHEYPVLSEANAEKKTFLLWMTEYFRVQLERTLAVLGIDVPEYM